MCVRPGAVVVGVWLARAAPSCHQQWPLTVLWQQPRPAGRCGCMVRRRHGLHGLPKTKQGLPAHSGCVHPNGRGGKHPTARCLRVSRPSGRVAVPEPWALESAQFLPPTSTGRETACNLLLVLVVEQVVCRALTNAWRLVPRPQGRCVRPPPPGSLRPLPYARQEYV